MQFSKFFKFLMLLLIAGVWVIALRKTSFGLADLKDYQSQFIEYYHQSPGQTLLYFFLAYVLSAALSLPVATVLTLASGALFGFWMALALVSVASTVGATLAFWVSRFLLKDWAQKKFPKPLQKINDGMKKDGLFYLFGLRASPIFPFFLVNVLMGVTPISTVNYFWVSQLGMLPATALYVNVGNQIQKLTSINDVLSPSIILSFSLIGFFPLLVKKILPK